MVIFFFKHYVIYFIGGKLSQFFFNVLICSATAQSVQTMIVGRLLAGIGIGISSAIVPLYISEVVFKPEFHKMSDILVYVMLLKLEMIGETVLDLPN